MIVAKIVEYSDLLERLKSRGIECHYYNSGAFGFPAIVTTHIAGWIGPDDPTIRPEMRAHARAIDAPYEPNLANLATRAWRDLLTGPAWVMPASHWAFELDFASKTWLPQLLEANSVDAKRLASLTNAAAVEFSPDETGAFTAFVQQLLENLLASDFTIAFPEHPLVCRLHHHKQLWWMTTAADLHARLSKLADDTAV
jgi:hypothetical protein